MQAHDDKKNDQSFRELLKAKISDPNLNAVLIGENHGLSFTPSAILANIDILENAGRKVIYVAEELEQHASQSIQAMHAAQVAQDIKFYDANLYNTLSNHGITVLGGESKESSPLYGLSGHERANVGRKPETQKMMSGMQRIIGGNVAFADVVNQAIKDNPGAIVVFVGGATHPVALEKNGITDEGMAGRIPNSVAINLVKTTENFDNVMQNVGYKESGADGGVGKYPYQVGSSKENCYKQAFDSQPTPKEKFDRLSAMTNDLVQSYSQFYKSGTAAFKENCRIITGAFKASNHLPADAKFDSFDKLMGKILESGGAEPNKNIKFNSSIKKDIDNALKADIKKMNPDLYKALDDKQEKRVSSTAALMGKIGGKTSSFLDKAKNAISSRRKDSIAAAPDPVKHDIGPAADPVKPAAVSTETKKVEIESTAVSVRPGRSGSN
jgi:hypothetical protein